MGISFQVVDTDRSRSAQDSPTDIGTVTVQTAAQTCWFSHYCLRSKLCMALMPKITPLPRPQYARTSRENLFHSGRVSGNQFTFSQCDALEICKMLLASTKSRQMLECLGSVGECLCP